MVGCQFSNGVCVRVRVCVEGGGGGGGGVTVIKIPYLS